MFFNKAQKVTKYLGYFVTKCVAKNFQKLANLVTLLVNVFLRQKRLKFSDE